MKSTANHNLARFNIRMVIPGKGNSIIKRKQLWEHLNLIMEIPLLERQHLYWNNPYSLALRQGDQLKDHTSTIKPKLILVSCFIIIFLLWCMGLLSISSMQELLWIIPWILPMVYESQQSLCSYQSVVLIPYYAPEVSDIKRITV